MEKLCGPRILTFFLYLSDVEEGGTTDFTKLGISVKPKLGNVLLWPSVLDEDPTEVDWRMQHYAKPVTKGIKYAANHWVRLTSDRTLSPRHKITFKCYCRMCRAVSKSVAVLHRSGYSTTKSR